MAIPSSGSLAISAIQTEFGGSNPVSMSEYYSGGDNVPSGISMQEELIHLQVLLATMEQYLHLVH